MLEGTRIEIVSVFAACCPALEQVHMPNLDHVSLPFHYPVAILLCHIGLLTCLYFSVHTGLHRAISRST